MPSFFGRNCSILPAAALIILLSWVNGALAQSVGPDEGAGSDGAIAPSLSLSPSQRSALYQVARQQHDGRTSAMQIDPTVGAIVSRSVELSTVPDQTGIDDSMILKYAMVEGDVVVVDSVRMRVVDIIHGSTRP